MLISLPYYNYYFNYYYSIKANKKKIHFEPKQIIMMMMINTEHIDYRNEIKKTRMKKKL